MTWILDWPPVRTAPVAGPAPGQVGSSPGWDGTGVAAAAVLAASVAFSFARPSRAWLWMPPVGTWIPVCGIALRNHGSPPAVFPSTVGAFDGSGARSRQAGRPRAA